jgi:ABC-2 type transport system permease protein
MLANVFTKSSSDRATGMVVGAAVIGLMLWAGMAVYRDIDLAIYDSLPPAMRNLMGIPEGADAASMAFGAIYTLMGALTLGGIAISIGASSIAGEERDGTMGLLLGNPVSRTGVYGSKAGALVLLAALGTGVMWGAAYVVPWSLSVDMGAMEIEALMVHLFANTLLYGFLALAIGGWTGRRGVASGAAAGVMVAGYLAAGIIPLIEQADGWERLAPWYWFDGSQPVLNGVEWGHVSVLLGGVVVLCAVGFLGVRRRDLRAGGNGGSMLDRLRENPRLGAIVERIAGSARVGSVFAKTISDHQVVAIVSGVVMFYLGLMMGPVYAFIPDDTWGAFEQLPDVLVAMIGGADFATAEGFFQAEIFSITAPIAIGVVTIVMGARALAGEERQRTMGLLLASPITRRRVVLEKFGAIVVHASVVGVGTFVGTWAGIAIAGVELSLGGVAAASVLLVCFGIFLGALSLALSAASGIAAVATYGTVGIGLVSYFAWAFLPVNERLADWAQLSPFHYFLGSEPLVNGLAWGDAAILLGLSLIVVGISLPFFDRRDLHR